MIRLHRWVASLSTVATLASACASNRVPVYVAPSTATIESGTEMTLGGDGQVVFVYNHSSVPIKVTGLHLLECENIKNRCDLQLLRVPVPAGQRVILTTVRPDNTSRPWSLDSHFLGNQPVTSASSARRLTRAGSCRRPSSAAELPLCIEREPD